MYKICRIAVLLLLGMAFNVYSATFQISGKNTLRYALGKEWAGINKDIELDKKYFENWTDLDFSYEDFSGGIRYEITDLSENGEELKEITKRYFSYATGDLTLYAGDFNAFFGRGMVLHAREKKEEFFDSTIDGAKVEFDDGIFAFTALGGDGIYRYVDDVDVANKGRFINELKTSLRGVSGSVGITDILEIEDYSFRLGASFLHMKGSHTDFTNEEMYHDLFINESEVASVNTSIYLYGLDVYSEYAIKNTYLNVKKQGWASYTSLSYAWNGLSLTAEYKDYYQFSANPNRVNSGFSAYQDPPEVKVESPSHLLKANPHEVNANDEIGFKILGSAKIAQDFLLNLSYALSSRHDENYPLPKMDDKFLPYHEGWGDLKYAFEGGSVLVGGGYFYDTPTSKGQNPDFDIEVSDPDYNYTYQRITGLGEFEFDIDEYSSMKMAAEYQKIEHRENDIAHDYDDIYGSIEYAYPEYGYVGVSVTKTTEELEGDAKDIWMGFEVGTKIYDKHELSLFYGRERAGIKCTGGSCRQVPEYDGFKLKLVSRF